MADPDRKRRFVQEAKAASALNHPNIITIHDIASDNGTDFIVMEYVEGKTLGQLIPRRGMELNEVLKYAIQIADALAKAHAARIVHRDLKPGNIMVSEGGLVKVLDFGLAKLTERPQVGEAESTGTLQPQTEEGMILGTASYMSPEQAAGKPVDLRSDIFSFGSVLYEMVTGQRAFQGDSKMSTLAAILNQEPKSAREIARTLPHDLEKIITRCLRKEPSRRSQSMADVKVALEELKEESDSGSPRATDAQEPSRKSRRFSAVTWAAVGVVAIALLAGAAWFHFHRSPTLPQMTVRRLTSYPGKEKDPALSPDGKRLAFAWDGESGDNFDIYVQSIGPAGELPLTAKKPQRLTEAPVADFSPAWSPDGDYLAFVRAVSDTVSAVYVMSSMGGEEKKLTELYSIWSEGKSLDWSPDGKFLVTAGKELPSDPYSLFLISLDTRDSDS